ncbi:MAG TPA: organomercurial lyase [Acidimicrobiia bacterium]|nr:organomercurial lyase [Acidimicrobiia bacterium]
MTIDAKIEDWANQLAAATPSLDHEQQRIARQIYHLIAANAEPVTVAQIADSAKVSPDRVEESLRSWPLVLWDDQDRVVGFWGIHAEHITPTHAITVDGRTVYAWCAWDTLFITEILGRQTKITSTDPRAGTPINLTVTPEGVVRIDPPEAVVSLLLPEDGLTDDAIQRFCHKVHFFTTPASAEAWIDGRPGLFAVTVDEAFDLGRATNRLRMSSVIGSDAGEGG